MPNAAADILFTGGEIVTLNPRIPRPEALAVTGGRIAALGSSAEVRAHRGPGTQEVNLNGRVLLPALRDHHLHLQAIGFALLNRAREGALFLDLSAVGSEAELVQLATARAAQQPPGTWVVGSGWNETLWRGRRTPSHHGLSAALPNNPAFLVRIDSHSALVNAQAMRAAGITRDSVDPPGGEIRRGDDGEPTGMLVERAVEQVLDRIPVPADEVVRQATVLAAHAMAARGYTDVFDAGIMHFPGLVAMNSPMQSWLGILRDVDMREPLPVNVNIMVPAPSEAAERVLLGKEPRQLSPRVRYTHLKLYCDGAFGSRGALLHEPYSDDPGNRGISRMTESEMLEFSTRALAVGLDVAIHAIGDAAVTRVLNVYETILRDEPGIAPRRLRLEHFSVATSSDIERAARLGILIVAQPGFVWPFADGTCMEDARLGPERVKRAYVWRTLLDMGAQVVGSSDDYGLPPHPLWNYCAAAHRQNPAGLPTPGWQPQERLTPEDAFRLFSGMALPGGAFTSGQLEKHAPADLAILSHNPLGLSAERLHKVRVHGTMRGGEWTFQGG